MAVQFNNPFKASKTKLDAAIKLVVIGAAVAGFFFMVVSAIIENNDPVRQATIKANYIIKEQSESDLRWCLREAQHNQEKIAVCKDEYITRETK